MADIPDAQDLLTLSEATRHLPKYNGRRPHSSTVWRWCRKGVRTRGGERVYLLHLRLGGRLFITRQALDEFGRNLAQADVDAFASRSDDRPRPSKPKSRTEQQRERDIRAANKILRDAGIIDGQS